MKRLRKVGAWLLLMAVLITCIPVNILKVEAQDGATTENITVTVSVENTTYESLPEFHKGIWLPPLSIEVPKGSTAALAITQALQQAYQQDSSLTADVIEGSWGPYIDNIKGLSNQGGSYSGWVVSVNDWFGTTGIGGTIVQDQDNIRILYSCDGGIDVGNDYIHPDTALESLSFTSGTLDEAFTPQDTQYVLTIPDDTASLSYNASAANKAFQLQGYQNQYLSQDAKRKKNEVFTVSAGDWLYIGVGDSAWENSFWGDYERTIYAIQVVKQGETTEHTIPGFQTFELNTNDLAAGQWTVRTSFFAGQKEYTVKLKDGNTSSLHITNGTTYNTDKYTAKVSYTNRNNQQVEYDLASAQGLELADLGLGTTTATIRLTETGTSNVIDYTFHIQRIQPQTVTQSQVDSISDKMVTNYQAENTPEYGYEWNMITLAGLDQLSQIQRQTYFKSVADEVKKLNSNRLSKSYATTNARVVLTLSAMGYDPANVAGYNLVEPLTDETWVENQGINSICYALLALDSCKYGTDEIRDKYVKSIAAQQMANGAFTWGFGGNGDTDLTAYVIQALTPYYKPQARTVNGINPVIDKAISYLSNAQATDGNYVGVWDTSSESLAQTIIALTGLGIDPKKDTRFVKNGISLLDAMYQFYLGDGTFSHTIGSSSNVMATQQCGLAIAAYQRFLAGKTGIYQTGDIAKIDGNVIPGSNGDITLIPDTGKIHVSATLHQQVSSHKKKVKKTDESVQEPVLLQEITEDNKESVTASADSTDTAISETENAKSGNNTIFIIIIIVCAGVVVIGISYLVITGKKKKIK